MNPSFRPDDVPPDLYEEIYRITKEIVRHQLRFENRAAGIRTTAIAHDVLLRARNVPHIDWSDTLRVRCLIANVTRHAVIDHARRARAAKRGGGRSQVPLDELIQVPGCDAFVAVELEDLLEALALRHPRQGKVAELRVFSDMTNQEIGDAIGVSTRTVQNDWMCARAWLASRVRAS